MEKFIANHFLDEWNTVLRWKDLVIGGHDDGVRILSDCITDG